MSDFIHPTPIAYRDIDLSWMVGRSVSSVSFHEPLPWIFALGSGSAISVECLWRIVEQGRIVLCSGDHGQQFGLPVPLDAATRATALLAGPIMRVELREATADILIEFADDRRLEIIPISAGYEAWHLSAPSGKEFVAQGGGQICTWTES